MGAVNMFRTFAIKFLLIVANAKTLKKLDSNFVFVQLTTLCKTVLKCYPNIHLLFKYFRVYLACHSFHNQYIYDVKRFLFLISVQLFHLPLKNNSLKMYYAWTNSIERENFNPSFAPSTFRLKIKVAENNFEWEKWKNATLQQSLNKPYSFGKRKM